MTGVQTCALPIYIIGLPVRHCSAGYPPRNFTGGLYAASVNVPPKHGVPSQVNLLTFLGVCWMNGDFAPGIDWGLRQPQQLGPGELAMSSLGKHHQSANQGLSHEPPPPTRAVFRELVTSGPRMES